MPNDPCKTQRDAMAALQQQLAKLQEEGSSGRRSGDSINPAVLLQKIQELDEKVRDAKTALFNCEHPVRWFNHVAFNDLPRLLGGRLPPLEARLWQVSQGSAVLLEAAMVTFQPAAGSTKDFCFGMRNGPGPIQAGTQVALSIHELADSALGAASHPNAALLRTGAMPSLPTKPPPGPAGYQIFLGPQVTVNPARTVPVPPTSLTAMIPATSFGVPGLSAAGALNMTIAVTGAVLNTSGNTIRLSVTATMTLAATGSISLAGDLFNRTFGVGVRLGVPLAFTYTLDFGLGPALSMFDTKQVFEVTTSDQGHASFAGTNPAGMLIAPLLNLMHQDAESRLLPVARQVISDEVNMRTRAAATAGFPAGIIPANAVLSVRSVTITGGNVSVFPTVGFVI